LVVDHRPHGKDRARFERVLSMCSTKHIEFICLPALMRLLTAEFVLQWQGACSTSILLYCRPFPVSTHTARR
jgi:hypothetical protein